VTSDFQVRHRAAPVLEALDAEHGIVGAILANNRCYELVAQELLPEHFTDGVCGRIYDDAARRIRAGQVADVVTLRNFYEADGMLAEVGGPLYLAQLVRAAVSSLSLRSYLAFLLDLWRRRQIIAVADSARIRALALDDADDGATIAGAIASDLLGLADAGTHNTSTSAGHAADAVLKAAEAARERGGKAAGVPSGIAGVDRLLGGFSAGQFVIIGARPAVGKTAVALNFAIRAARAGVGVAIFSLEMASEELGERLLANLAGSSATAIRDGNLSQCQWDAVVAARNDLATLPILIDDRARLSVESVRLRAMAMTRKQPLGLIVVDHIGLLVPPVGFERANPTIVTEQNSKSLKALAKELGATVLGLSQLNRGLENRDEKRPGLADLRWSGSLEQDADVVMFIHREEIHLRGREPSWRPDETAERHSGRIASHEATLHAVAGRGELIIAKQRRGPTGTVLIFFDGAQCRISDIDAAERTR
jgi:replicative DNA helicase